MKKNSIIITKQYALRILFSCLIFNIGYSQINLVNNHSFEVYDVCPSKLNRFPPNNWYLATNNGPIYSNSCDTSIYASVPYNYVKGASYQFARNGNAYVLSDYENGPNSNQRGYLQTKLKDSLRNGKSYYVEHFVNSPNSQKLACNNVGVLFTKTAVYVDTNAHPYGVLPANPQIVNYGNPIIADTLNWIKVSGIFKAQGGEQYLTLGNFKFDNQTQYTQFLPTGYACAGYYIDDVSVIPLDSFCLKADAGKDTTITVNDSVFIGSYTNGIDTIKWYNAAGQIIDSTRPGFIIHPTNTGTTMYIVEQTINGCTSRDTVNINVVLPLKFISYNLQETRNRINEKQVTSNWVTVNEINVSHFNIQRSTNGKEFITIGKVVAQNKTLNNYTYNDEQTRNDKQETWFYRIESIDFDGKKQYTETKRVKLNEQQETGNIVLFPNPAKNIVNIECKDGIKEIKLFNAMGKQIATGTNLRNDGNLKIQTLNLQQVSKGLYLVKVLTNKNEINNVKLVVE